MLSDLSPFVSAQWLAENYDDVVVCDVRMRPDAAQARSEYEAGHLPGARFVDLNSDLAAPPGDGVGRHPLHDPVIFAAVLGILGIGIDTPVVAYDERGRCTCSSYGLDAAGHGNSRSSPRRG